MDVSVLRRGLVAVAVVVLLGGCGAPGTEEPVAPAAPVAPVAPVTPEEPAGTPRAAGHPDRADARDRGVTEGDQAGLVGSASKISGNPSGRFHIRQR